MGLKRKLRSLEQTEANLDRLFKETELPKIKKRLRAQWEKEQLEKKNKVGVVFKVVRKIFGRKK